MDDIEREDDELPITRYNNTFMYRLCSAIFLFHFLSAMFVIYDHQHVIHNELIHSNNIQIRYHDSMVLHMLLVYQQLECQNGESSCQEGQLQDQTPIYY
jgi:hypothetical protein